MYFYATSGIQAASRNGHFYFTCSTDNYGFLFRTQQGGTPTNMLQIMPYGVGIGISPSYRLDVSGDCRISGNLLLPGIPIYDAYDDVAELRKIDLTGLNNLKDIMGYVVGGMKQLETRLSAIEKRLP